ncbi:MAG: hypothetical protein ABEI76_07495 [Halobacteriales archaeon]
MKKPVFRPITRRTAIALGFVVGGGSLVTPAVAKPPKKNPKPKPKPTPTPERDAPVRKIDLMGRTIEKIQARLKDCQSDVCGTVLEHSFARANLTKEARAAAEDREWKAATESLTEVRSIVEGDIALLESVDQRGTVGDVLGLERALLNQTDTALDAVERASVMPGDNVS